MRRTDPTPAQARANARRAVPWPDFCRRAEPVADMRAALAVRSDCDICTPEATRLWAPRSR